MLTREQHIWKAKHQRGLTDEQIQYFLDRDSRFDLLPYYSLGCNRLGCEQGLAEKKKRIYDKIYLKLRAPKILEPLVLF